MFQTVLIFLLIVLCPVALQAQERAVPEQSEQIQLSFAPIVKKVAPAVVNIYTKRTVSTGFRNPFMDDPFFGQFFDDRMFGGGMRKHVESALGSGVIVSEKGLAVTNAHVVRGAQEITIVLSNGNEYDAKLVLSDEASDLALLQVKEPDIEFPHVVLKPSESLEVGDLVLAIGNPFGVGQTVTSGIVSAQGRSSLDINDYNFFIQTDAAINPGNSGGPLVAMDGHVVGINTAIYSRSGGSQGIGFSIPSEMVASVIAAAVNGQTGDQGIIRPWLGVTAQVVTSDIATSLGMESPTGALVAELHSASPLMKSGVKVGDVVTSVNGYIIRDPAEMKFRMATVPIGKKAAVKLLSGGEEKTVQVLAIAPPDDPPREEVVLQGKHILNGAVIANLNPAVSIELGLRGEEQGVVVVSAPRGTYAARAVSSGDIFIEINGQKIQKTSDVVSALKDLTGRGLSMIVKRDGRISRIYMH